MENKFCAYCGALISDDSNFCIHCGRKVINPVKTVPSETFQPILQETVLEMPSEQKGSWGWVLGTCFGAFIVLAIICMII